MKDRFEEHLGEDRQEQVRSDLNEFVRLYAFLSQIVSFQDAALERLYIFSRYPKRILPVDREELPREIQEQIDIDSYGIGKTGTETLTPERGKGEIDPRGEKGTRRGPEHEKERLSAIIEELNDRFGAGLTEEDRISLENLESRLTDDEGLRAAARSTARENVRLTFENKVTTSRTWPRRTSSSTRGSPTTRSSGRPYSICCSRGSGATVRLIDHGHQRRPADHASRHGSVPAAQRDWPLATRRN